MALFIAVLFSAAPGLSCDGGGDAGGHSDSGSRTSPMDAQIIGHFFAVPIRMVPVEQPGRPPRDIPVMSAMSGKTRRAFDVFADRCRLPGGLWTIEMQRLFFRGTGR
ncbi:hypothetical protein [Pseudodesulfovibrio mercurii]|uniref:hypothetical protein n=1 Tax=Pseudodesulfovibrio mercurii TaxID=641491 RepID=UPI0002DF7288|nr:hypothetical protein [Pseudodesulfovibrio mercurii]